MGGAHARKSQRNGHQKEHLGIATDSTLNADAAAKDLPRDMVESLRNPDCKATLRIEVLT